MKNIEAINKQIEGDREAIHSLSTVSTKLKDLLTEFKSYVWVNKITIFTLNKNFIYLRIKKWRNILQTSFTLPTPTCLYWSKVASTISVIPKRNSPILFKENDTLHHYDKINLKRILNASVAGHPLLHPKIPLLPTPKYTLDRNMNHSLSTTNSDIPILSASTLSMDKIDIGTVEFVGDSIHSWSHIFF